MCFIGGVCLSLASTCQNIYVVGVKAINCIFIEGSVQKINTKKGKVAGSRDDDVALKCAWLQHFLLSWESKGTPPMPSPPGNKALLRDY